LKGKDAIRAIKEVFLNFFTISLVSLTVILLVVLYL